MLCEAVFSLCGEIRQPVLNLTGGGERLAQQLRFACGVAAELDVPPIRWRREDLVLLFSPCEAWADTEAQLVPLFDAALSPRYRCNTELPDLGLVPQQFLSTLCSAGILRPEMLEIEDLGGWGAKNYRCK